MEIKVNGSSEIVVSGNIKNVSDYQEIKKVVSDVLRDTPGELVIDMPDSFSITSSVIGFFLKLVFQDGVKLSLIVHDERLFTLLDDLRLLQAFNVQKKF